MKDIVVGVILFNPDIDILENNLETILKQFNQVILFDNSEKSNETVISALKYKEKVVYKSENKNCGMAYALNRIMEIAGQYGYSWVITFDQDSKIPNNIYQEYSKYLNKMNVGIICSQVIDKRRKYMELDGNHKDFEKVNKCITSASCTKIEAWKQAGKYDEMLFIDLVDNDFSKRVKYIGYDIYRANNVILEQEYGNIEYKNTLFAKVVLWIGKKIHNNNIAKLSYKKKVSPMRIYYTNRNVLYLNKKHKLYGGIGYESYYCNSYIEFYLLFNLASIFRSDKKLEVLKAVIKGTYDGILLCKEAIPYSFRNVKVKK